MTGNMEIFNTYDVSDIPEALKSGLRQDDYADQIIQLFKLAGVGVELTVDNVTVAYYRKFTAGTDNEPKKKNAIMAKLYSMGRDKDNPIESVTGKKGTYRLKGEISEKILIDTNLNGEQKTF
ncbi:MAG: hypothetical protein JW974_02365 [Alphaproteobacteria bacterium]|nr:hypothetical protein [Alphaproteobacteria bacterium]MBN2675262.1 hypothetical protein [Alphaproteobacteria bacterium]